MDIWIDSDVEYKVTEKYVNGKCAFLQFELSRQNKHLFLQSITISDYEIKITVEGNGELEIAFPVLEFDGQEYTKIFTDKNSIEVLYKNHNCIFVTENAIIDKNMPLANRNGHYKAFAVRGKNDISLKIKLIEMRG